MKTLTRWYNPPEEDLKVLPIVRLLDAETAAMFIVNMENRIGQGYEQHPNLFSEALVEHFKDTGRGLERLLDVF